MKKHLIILGSLGLLALGLIGTFNKVNIGGFIIVQLIFMACVIVGCKK